MRLYRSLRRIPALTFDLDDTLYGNRPVITHAEQGALAFVQSYRSVSNSLQNSDLQRLRQAVHDAEPEICHDATQWCHHAVERAMLEARLSAVEARMGASTAMMNFAKRRSRVRVPQPTHDTLKALAYEWSLVVITNGNARPELSGLGGYFEFVLRAGPDGRSKPFNGMYILTAERLKMPVGKILHVGDDLTTDAAGATRRGIQTYWIKPEDADLMRTADSHLLPRIEISQLTSLASLI